MICSHCEQRPAAMSHGLCLRCHEQDLRNQAAYEDLLRETRSARLSMLARAEAEFAGDWNDESEPLAPPVLYGLLDAADVAALQQRLTRHIQPRSACSEFTRASAIESEVDALAREIVGLRQPLRICA